VVGEAGRIDALYGLEDLAEIELRGRKRYSDPLVSVLERMNKARPDLLGD
jgi:hypothetical protein